MTLAITATKLQLLHIQVNTKLHQGVSCTHGCLGANYTILNVGELLPVRFVLAPTNVKDKKAVARLVSSIVQ